MKRSILLIAALAGSFLISNHGLAQTVATNPVGFVTTTVTTGTTASLGLPFNRPADFVGLVSTRTSTTLQNTGANWTPNGFGPFASNPHVVLMLSGASKGRDFIIDSNTADTLTITTEGDLTTQIASSDQFQVMPCHTLASLFGTDAAGLVSSNNSSTADLVQLRENNAWITYFHTAGVNGFWAQVGGGSTNFNNHAILPSSGLLLVRRGASDFSFTALGAVPTTNLKTDLPANQTAHLSNRFPVDTTLNALGLHSLPNWISSNSSSSADQVLMRVNNAWLTFFHTAGANGFWAQVGGGSTNHNADVIAAGAAVLVSRRPGTDVTLDQPLPYTLP